MAHDMFEFGPDENMTIGEPRIQGCEEYDRGINKVTLRSSRCPDIERMISYDQDTPWASTCTATTRNMGRYETGSLVWG